MGDDVVAYVSSWRYGAWGASSQSDERLVVLVLQFFRQALYCISYLVGGRLVVVFHGDGGEVGALPLFHPDQSLGARSRTFGTDEHLRV